LLYDILKSFSQYFVHYVGRRRIESYKFSDKRRFACDPFKFEKRCQFFIRVHNETLSVVAMRVCNPDRLPGGIIEAELAGMEAEHDALASHIFVSRRSYRNANDTKGGKRREINARLSFNTACELGFRGGWTNGSG
jgi:hypothetical protein